MTAAGLNVFSLLVRVHHPLLRPLCYLPTGVDHSAKRNCQSKFDAVWRHHHHAHAHFPRFLGVTTNPAGSYRATPTRLVLYYWVTVRSLVPLSVPARF
jgi:hypothetical protein